MSKIGDLLTGTVAATVGNSLGGLFSALFMTGRSIGGIIPDVTIEESTVDRLTVTRHPVERGASVTDHAYREPTTITMRVGWSDSNTATRSIVSGSIFSGSIKTANDMYQDILDLQISGKRFDLVTGKRTFKDVLITEVRSTTNAETENVVLLEIDMQRQIVVSTVSVSLISTTSQADPAATGPTQNTGTKQAVKAPQQSALSILFGD